MKNKFNYLRVIQQNYNYGQGWEDVCEYSCNSQGLTTELSDKLSPNGKPESLLKHDLREYRKMGYPTRVITRRELVK